VVGVQVDRAGPLPGSQLIRVEKESSRIFMTGTTPDAWFSIFLIGAPASRRFVSMRATPPPRFDSWRAELIDRPIDSIESSTRSRKQEISSPRCFLPALRNVGVAG